MQQAWDVMTKPLVKVADLTELQNCKGCVAYLERPVDTGILRVYAMPKGCEWPLVSGGNDGNRRFLVARPCWGPLWKAVLDSSSKSSGAIVTGSPGIGKSWFGSFMLLQRAQQTLKPDYTSCRTLLHDGKEMMITSFVDRRVESVLTNRDKPLHVHKATTKPWYIYDPPEAGGRGGVASKSAFIVTMASPNPAHYSALDKTDSALFYMQPWSLAELQAVRDVMVLVSTKLGADEVQERFDRFGGVCRYIFSDQYAKWLVRLSTAIGEADPVWMAQQMDRGAEGLSPHLHKLFNCHVDDIKAPTTIKIKLASQFVFRQMVSAVRKLKHAQLERLWHLDHPASAEFRGRLYADLYPAGRASSALGGSPTGQDAGGCL